MIRSLRFALVASALAAAGPWAPALGLGSGASAPAACAARASGIEENTPLASSALAAPRASAAAGLAAEPERTGGRSNESGPRPCRTGTRVLAEPSSGVRPARTTHGAAPPRAASGLLGLVSAPANAPPGS